MDIAAENMASDTVEEIDRAIDTAVKQIAAQGLYLNGATSDRFFLSECSKRLSIKLRSDPLYRLHISKERMGTRCKPFRSAYRRYAMAQRTLTSATTR